MTHDVELRICPKGKGGAKKSKWSSRLHHIGCSSEAVIGNSVKFFVTLGRAKDYVSQELMVSEE